MVLNITNLFPLIPGFQKRIHRRDLHMRRSDILAVEQVFSLCVNGPNDAFRNPNKILIGNTIGYYNCT